jgi:hypothetical protein
MGYFIKEIASVLKGHSHEKVSENVLLNDSLGSNYKVRQPFFNL